jgi:hypothetical protein
MPASGSGLRKPRSASSIASRKPETSARGVVILLDPTAPSGQRVLHLGEAWHNLSRFPVCQAAKQRCEGCEDDHLVPWPRGEAHHRLGRGGGRRTDLVWMPMQPATEPNLARWRWFRNLLWTCFTGHQRLERISTAKYRRGLMRFCECGLLVIERRNVLPR